MTIVENIKLSIKQVISSSLSNESKRLIVLSSLAGKLEKVIDPTQEVLHKLNNILNICHDDRAMLFPMYISSLIWGKQDSINIDLKKSQLKVDRLSELKAHELTETQVKVVAGLISRKIPKHLAYASNTSMRQDIILLLKQILTVKPYPMNGGLFA